MTEDLACRKKAIRKRILALRAELSDSERTAASKRVAGRVIAMKEFEDCEELLCFAGYGTEIDTGEILQEALKRGKKVYLPKVITDTTGRMEFYRIFRLTDLKPGYKSIPEPIGDTDIFQIQSSQSAFMLMPGVAFDSYGRRLGYGLGFYDRYLQDKPILARRTVAIGFACQMLSEELPCSSYDIKPAGIICL